MENLKVKVSNEAESKEVQKLFFELGYYWAYKNLGKKLLLSEKDIYLFAESSGILGTGVKENESFFNDWRGKEVTLQELRDMVVFKRESLNDKIATAEVVRQEEKHSHYKKDVSHLNVIDVYRVLELYGVESHAVGHAIKKLLCCGQRGAKGRKQDIQEAIDSLNRELEMVTEDEL